MTNSDKIKGRAKETLGDLTGDGELKREGKVDRAAGSVKEGVNVAKEKVKDIVDGDHRR